MEQVSLSAAEYSLSNATADALTDRLRTALALIKPELESAHLDQIELLDELLDSGRVDSQTTWLALVAVSTVLPTSAQVIELRREMEFAGPGFRAHQVLSTGLDLMLTRGTPLARLCAVTDKYFVDVDSAARMKFNTGIQRVTRNVMPSWIKAGHPVQLACWADRDQGYRDLSSLERARVLQWGNREDWSAGENEFSDELDPQVLIPWGTTVVLPEVPSSWHCETLTALARFTPNRVVAIGHDCIPVVSAELLPAREADKFVSYLSLVKHIDLVVAVSSAAAKEFQGFCAALDTQGLTGPQVVWAGLAVDVPQAAIDVPAVPADPPQILCVGSHEPRKNHMAVLFAAETLWREGLQFTLRLIGGQSWDDQGFGDWVKKLKSKGRKLVTDHSASDQELWDAYRTSWFTVFASLHEGFGLPAGESLAFGIPLITSNREPMSNNGAGGGAILIDPTNDDQMVDAMRSLLTDHGLREKLAAEARERTFKGWVEYSENLWRLFADGHAIDLFETNEISGRVS